VKLLSKMESGVILVDSKGRRFGRVAEVIGPVRTPYASCIPLTDKVSRGSEAKLFVIGEGDKSGRSRTRRQ